MPDKMNIQYTIYNPSEDVDVLFKSIKWDVVARCSKHRKSE